jgi:defect-in-organelle-trafficking protein DotC
MIRICTLTIFFFSVLSLCLVSSLCSVLAAESVTPPTLAELQQLDRNDQNITFGGEELEFEKLDIRLDALREAALSLGARGGLATRTKEIRETLDLRQAYMDQVYDFRRLLIKAPSGMMIEPPIVNESFDNMNIETDGQLAAVADRILNINREARIVSTPRNWRTYLERDWGKVQRPPAVLMPKTEDEKREWQALVAKGWREGVEQADAIFQSDLNRLNSDFQGMVRYRILLTQGIITPPFALEIDRGVTGGGSEMRVGDRAVQITGPSQLKPDAYLWKPANR